MSLPNYDLNRIEALEELSTIEGYDPSYTLVYFKSWQDIESEGWLAIFERNGEYFKCDGGYNPEAWNIGEKMLYEPLSEEQAQKEINEFEAICDDNTSSLSM